MVPLPLKLRRVAAIAILWAMSEPTELVGLGDRTLDDCNNVRQIDWILSALIESGGRKTVALRKLKIGYLEFDRWLKRKTGSEIREAVEAAIAYGRESMRDDCAGVLHEVAVDGCQETGERVKAATAYLKSETDGVSTRVSVNLKGSLDQKSGADLARELLGEAVVVETTVREVDNGV